MQLIWVLPSIIFGVYMGLSTGSWLLLGMSAGSAAVAILSSKSRALQRVDFTQPIEFVDNHFWVGSKRMPRSRIFWRREWNQHFYRYFELQHASQKPRLPLEQRHEFSDPGPLSMFLGYHDSQPQISSLEKHGSHLLIIGPTGSGKSVLLKQIAGSLASGSTSDESNFAFIDFKGNATFSKISGTRIKFSASDLDLAAADSALLQIGMQISVREKTLHELGASDFRAANQSGHKMPALIIIIDELGALLKSIKSAVELLDSLAAKGRSLGIFLIAANQTTFGIPRSLLLNMRQRIALAGTDPLELNQLGFKSRAADPNRQSSVALIGSWARASGEVSDFAFHADFDLEKTFTNRHFSG